MLCMLSAVIHDKPHTTLTGHRKARLYNDTDTSFFSEQSQERDTDKFPVFTHLRALEL